MPKVSYNNEPLDKLTIDDDIQSFVNDIFDSLLVYIMEQGIDKSLESVGTLNRSGPVAIEYDSANGGRISMNRLYVNATDLTVFVSHFIITTFQ